MTANPKQGMEYLGVNHVALVAIEGERGHAVSAHEAHTLVELRGLRDDSAALARDAHPGG